MSFEELKMKLVKDKDVLEFFSFFPRGLFKIGEKKWFIPYQYTITGKKLYNLAIHPDDIWIVTYPRSGTTLMQEMVWLIKNDLNFDEAYQKDLRQRVPFIDMSVITDQLLFKTKRTPIQEYEKDSIEFVERQFSPRFIKSHMPLDLLPTVVNSDCKIIYIARNPKDVVVSWYYFQKNYNTSFIGNFEQFCDFFLTDRTLYSPYWEHVKQGWATRHRPNILFFFYEDLIKDLIGSIRKIVTFFGKSYSDMQIAKLAEHVNIKSFRRNPMVNKPTGDDTMKLEMFIRQGKINNWKEMFTPEIEEKCDKWIADNLKNTDLIFPN